MKSLTHRIFDVFISQRLNCWVQGQGIFKMLPVHHLYSQQHW